MTRDADPAETPTADDPATPSPSEAGPPPPGAAIEGATIEIALAAEDLPELARLPGMTRTKSRRPLSLVWYDDAEGGLAATGMTLVREGPVWRLQRLETETADWPACTPAPTLDEAAALADLSPAPPFDAAPVAAFEGTSLIFRAGEVGLDILDGSLRGVVEEKPACRVLLTGPPDALAAMVPALALLRTATPRASLGREALAVAKGQALPARHLGAPSLAADIALSDGLAAIATHLLDALLYWVDRYRQAQAPKQALEAVHQARVATRRLRSAFSLYRRALASRELDVAGAALKACAARLGAARDWDVFLDGAGERLGAIVGDDPRLGALLRAAQQRQKLAHAELADYLAGAEFRHLELGVGVAAALRPWERGVDAATLLGATAPFAAAVLDRRIKHVRRRGRSLAELPAEALHEMRKDCKRLRYAAEFFAPTFANKAVKPFIKRLAALQEELGTLNDMAAATHLMRQLGRAGRGYAGGMVEGWAAAQAVPSRERLAKRWKRFRAAAPFWTG